MTDNDNNIIGNDSQETINPIQPENTDDMADISASVQTDAKAEISVGVPTDTPAYTETANNGGYIPAAFSENTETDGYPNPFAVDEASTKKKKKGKGKKIALISGISAAVLIGGGALAYNLSDLVKNQVNLLIMKPDKYHSWVSTKNTENFAENTRKSYEEFLDKHEKGSASSIELKITPTKNAKETFLDLYKDNSADAQVIRDIVSDTEDLSVSLTTQTKKAEASVALGFNQNSDSLLSMELALDLADPKILMRFPEIKKDWFGVNLDEIFTQSVEDEASADDKEQILKLYDYFKTVVNDPSELITPKELEKSINTYTKAFIDSIDGVERDRKEKLKIGGITTEYTVLDVDINAKTAYVILNNIIEEAADDDVIKNIVIDKTGIFSEDDYDELIDELLEATNEINTESGELLTYQVYVDPKGDFRGVSVELEDTEIFFAMGKEKDNVAIELSVTADDTKMASLVLNAEEAGKDSYDGSLSLDFDEELVADFTDSEDAEDYTITIDFEDMSIGSLDDPKLNGDVTINIPDMDPIDIEFRHKGDTLTFTYDIKVAGKKYADISFIITRNEKCTIDLEEDNVIYTTEDENGEIDLKKHLTTDEILKYFTDLYLQLGIDEDTAEILAEESCESFFDESDDEDEEEYYFDNDELYYDEEDEWYSDDYDVDWYFDEDDNEWHHKKEDFTEIPFDYDSGNII